MATPTILFFPNVGKQSKKSQLIPITARIRNGRLKTEVNLEAYLTKDDLQFWNVFTQRLDKPNNRVNSVIEAIYYDFTGLPYTHKENYHKLHPNEIKEKIVPNKKGVIPQPLSLIGYLEDYYKNIVLPSSMYSKGTEKNYNKSINHLVKFLTYKKQKNIELKEFNYDLASQFNDYLMSEIPSIKKKALSQVSATSVFIKIKTMLKRAFDTGKISRNPFTGIKLATKSPKKARLTVDELSSLYNLTFKELPNLEIYRDIFLFQVYTGLSYGDFHNLKRSDIIISDNGYYLDTERIKTKNPVNQFLVSPAIDLINKYKDDIDVQVNNFVLPQRHMNIVNPNLKIIAHLAGIKKLVTTHTARRTCRQLLGNAGITDTQVICHIMGWWEGDEMNVLYNEVYDKHLLEARNLYDKYLKDNL